MTNVLKRLREKAGVALCVGAFAGALVLGVGQGMAAEWQVRMPVKKTARIAPQEDADQEAKSTAGKYGDKPVAKSAETTNEKPVAAKEIEHSAPKAAPKAAPKTALGRAAEAAATAAPKASSPIATEKSTPGKGVAAKPVDTSAAASPDSKIGDASAAKPSATPPAQAKKSAAPALSAAAKGPASASTVAPAPAKAPKPAPVVTVDPKAKLLPPATATAPTPLPLPASGKWVGDVAVEFQAESIVLHAATNSEVERVTWFNLGGASGPRKLAVDLRGPWHKKGASVLRYDVGPVKHVVVGEHEDRLRLSVEFRSGAVAKDLDPVLVRGPQGLSLTIPLAVVLAP